MPCTRSRIDNNGSGKEALTFQFRFTTVDCRS